MLPTELQCGDTGATVKDTPASVGFRGWRTRQGVQDGLQPVTAGPASGTPALTVALGLVHRGWDYLSLSLTHRHT